MTPTDWMLLALTVAVLTAGLCIAAAVKQAGGHVRNGVESTGHKAAALLRESLPGPASHLHRLAVAAETVADERPAQKNAKHYQDMSEGLLHGINAVLELDVEHPEGLKDDVITGRDQGVALVKDRLQTELTKALR